MTSNNSKWTIELNSDFSHFEVFDANGEWQGTDGTDGIYSEDQTEWAGLANEALEDYGMKLGKQTDDFHYELETL